MAQVVHDVVKFTGRKALAGHPLPPPPSSGKPVKWNWGWGLHGEGASCLAGGAASAKQPTLV